MKILFGLWWVLAAGAASAQTAWVNGKQIPINFPQDTVPAGYHVEGDQLLNVAGQKVGRWPYWGALAQAHGALDISKAEPYPLLVVVPTKRFVAQWKDGWPTLFWQFTHSSELESLESDIARLAAAIRVYSGGKLDPRIDYVVDTSAQDDDPAQTLEFRRNQVTFESDDPNGVKAYREAWMYGLPGASRPPFTKFTSMLGGWVQSVQAHRPYAVSALIGDIPARQPDELVSFINFGKLNSEQEPTSDDIALNGQRPEAAAAPAVGSKVPIKDSVPWVVTAADCFEKAPDGEYSFIEKGPTRRGSIDYVAQDGLLSLAKGGSLSFGFTSGWRDSFDVVLMGAPANESGPTGGIREIARHTIRPAQGQASTISIPLAGLQGFALQSVRIVGNGDKTTPQRIPIVLSALSFGPEAPAALPVVVPEIESQIASIVATADANTLVPSLNAPSFRVHAAAVKRLSELKAPSLVPMLPEFCNSSHPIISMLAAEALASQGTPESKAALAKAFDAPAFDYTQDALCRAIAAHPSPEFVAPLGLVLACSSWRARLSAVRALAEIHTAEAGQTMAIFINDPEPVVRVEVAKRAPLSDDIVRRRVLYAMVNDSCEAVRIQAALRALAEDPKSATFKEGASRLSDDSWAVRAGIVGGAPALDSLRGMFIQASHDPSATVRAAALRKLYAIKDKEVQPSEVAHLVNDSDFRVQTAWTEVALGTKLPADVLKSLAASKYESIRRRAEGLNK